MTTREKLHQVIERIPEESLERALRMVEPFAPDNSAESESGKSFFETATPAEFAAALDRIAAGHEGLPILPPEAFERESLCEENH